VRRRRGQDTAGRDYQFWRKKEGVDGSFFNLEGGKIGVVPALFCYTTRKKESS